MRILFVPFQGGISHIHPLAALASKLDSSQHQIAFLLAAEYHQLVKNIGIPVLDINHLTSGQDFSTEILAYKRFKPDIVVDDMSLSTYFTTQLFKVPRIAVQRTGMFPGYIPRQKNLAHSVGQLFAPEKYEIAQRFGLSVPTSFTGLFQAKMKIVPGIKEIEVLPQPLENDPGYIFAGPLILEDFLNEWDSRTGKFVMKNDFTTVKNFLDTNQNRYRVYVSFGNIATPSAEVLEVLRYLIANDFAVITNIDIGEIDKKQQELYFYSPYLPMHLVCSNVELMVHHCGSGTYQYPILHTLPMITVGTHCHGRVDVALCLEELGVNRHVPAPDECHDFFTRFMNAFETLSQPSNPTYQTFKRKLAKLKEESQKAMRAFDFEDVLKKASA
jgi:hypothetical protein